MLVGKIDPGYSSAESSFGEGIVDRVEDSTTAELEPADIVVVVAVAVVVVDGEIEVEDSCCHSSRRKGSSWD